MWTHNIEIWAFNRFYVREPLYRCVYAYTHTHVHIPIELSGKPDRQMTPPLWQKAKNYRAFWWKWKSEKVGLKLNIQKTKIMASGPITSW